MFFTNNPKENLIQDLRKSERLYEKIYAVVQDNPFLQGKVARNISDISTLIVYIETLSLDELETLIDNC